MPSHTHSRGLQNITGRIADRSVKQDDNYSSILFGERDAFYRTSEVSSTNYIELMYHNVTVRHDYINFDASKSWTGKNTFILIINILYNIVR